MMWISSGKIRVLRVLRVLGRFSEHPEHTQRSVYLPERWKHGAEVCSFVVQQQFLHTFAA